MASSRHLVLSDIIKGVHEELREKSILVGPDLAWTDHCENQDNLKNYASAMKELARNHWGKSDNYSEVASRLTWTVDVCKNYFANIGVIRAKEFEITEKMGTNIQSALTKTSFSEVWNLLDVGSCYNPFQDFDCFKVTAIDIAPASEQVYKCDFLSLKVGNKVTICDSTILELSKNYFDVIVFSLLLEYLPSPQQRKLCCVKAYDLLKTEGLLIIITPDSNHVGANAPLMKAWRFILAEMGFSRIKYEKLMHIHCMAFRKSFSRAIAHRWAKLHVNNQVYTEMFIPQDFKVRTRKAKSTIIYNPEEILRIMEELPRCFVD